MDGAGDGLRDGPGDGGRTTGPDPNVPHPLVGHPRVGFLRPLVDGPNIEIGEFTYYDDPAGPEHFVERCVLHHFEHSGDRLVIGRFCALATGVRFVMNGANHDVSGVSTYPFDIFGHGWQEGYDAPAIWAAMSRGDTTIGHDVWIGMDATVMPGVTIGHGAIVGALSVVTSDVRPYAIVAGNPAREIRRRFDDDTVARLLAIAWWDWPVPRITRGLTAIRGGNLDALERCA